MLFCSFYGCMLCLVRYLFVISTSVIDCLGSFVPEMTYYVSSGALNLTQLKLIRDSSVAKYTGFRLVLGGLITTIHIYAVY